MLRLLPNQEKKTIKRNYSFYFIFFFIKNAYLWVFFIFFLLKKSTFVVTHYTLLKKTKNYFPHMPQ